MADLADILTDFNGIEDFRACLGNFLGSKRRRHRGSSSEEDDESSSSSSEEKDDFKLFSDARVLSNLESLGLSEKAAKETVHHFQLLLDELQGRKNWYGNDEEPEAVEGVFEYFQDLPPEIRRLIISNFTLNESLNAYRGSSITESELQETSRKSCLKLLESWNNVRLRAAFQAKQPLEETHENDLGVEDLDWRLLWSLLEEFRSIPLRIRQFYEVANTCPTLQTVISQIDKEKIKVFKTPSRPSSSLIASLNSSANSNPKRCSATIDFLVKSHGYIAINYLLGLGQSAQVEASAARVVLEALRRLKEANRPKIISLRSDDSKDDSNEEPFLLGEKPSSLEMLLFTYLSEAIAAWMGVEVSLSALLPGFSEILKEPDCALKIMGLCQQTIKDDYFYRLAQLKYEEGFSCARLYEKALEDYFTRWPLDIEYLDLLASEPNNQGPLMELLMAKKNKYLTRRLVKTIVSSIPASSNRSKILHNYLRSFTSRRYQDRHLKSKKWVLEIILAEIDLTKWHLKRSLLRDIALHANAGTLSSLISDPAAVVVLEEHFLLSCYLNLAPNANEHYRDRLIECCKTLSSSAITGIFTGLLPHLTDLSLIRLLVQNIDWLKAWSKIDRASFKSLKHHNLTTITRIFDLVEEDVLHKLFLKTRVKSRVLLLSKGDTSFLSRLSLETLEARTADFWIRYYKQLTDVQLESFFGRADNDALWEWFEEDFATNSKLFDEAILTWCLRSPDNLRPVLKTRVLPLLLAQERHSLAKLVEDCLA